MAVFMFGNGMVMPNSMAGAIGPFPRMAGAASALLGSLQMTAGSLAGIAAGHQHDGTPRPMASMIGGFSLAACAGFWLLIARRSPGHPPADLYSA